MNARFRKKPLTFGEFITAAGDAWGKRRARGMVRLAFKTHLVEFRSRRRIVVS